MNVHMILSVDYEIFGNGLGYVGPCVVDPARRIMKVAKAFDAPITFFVEATEFIAMKASGVSVNGVHQQLAHAVARGHDAQLHIHPQWEQATNSSGGTWKVDNDCWRIGDLPFEDSLRLLRTGKTWLEEAVDSANYRVLAFRAGGWCIQPSGAMVQALLQLGFLVDSTVAPGFRNVARGEWSDFRSVPGKAYWKTDEDVCRADLSGLWEVPIVTGRIAPWRHLRAVKSSRSSGDGGLACGCEGNYRGPDGGWGRWKGKLGKLMGLGHVMLDFSTMPVDVLTDVTLQWIDRYGDDAKALPLVAIAHTKNFTLASAQHLADYLTWVQEQGIQFSTYGQWLDSIRE